MIRGLYTSATGMLAELARQDVVANNLANADSVGYKRDNLTEVPFSEYLMNAYAKGKATPIGQLGLGVDVISRYSDFGPGAITVTDNPTDFAIEGNAFFAVERNGAVAYTRAGNFLVNQDNVLVTQNGDPVLGENGSITVNGPFTVSPAGEVMENGQVIARLRLAATAGMIKQGDSYYTNSSDTPAPAGDYQVIQGALERSNVNSIREMVQMITVTRSYDANQKVLTAQDDTLGKAVNDLAK